MVNNGNNMMRTTYIQLDIGNRLTNTENSGRTCVGAAAQSDRNMNKKKEILKSMSKRQIVGLF